MTGEGGGCPAESATVCQYTVSHLSATTAATTMLPARDAATFADNSTSSSITAAEAASSHPAPHLCQQTYGGITACSLNDFVSDAISLAINPAEPRSRLVLYSLTN